MSKKDKEQDMFVRMKHATDILTKAGPKMMEEAYKWNRDTDGSLDGPIIGKLKNSKDVH